MAHHRGRRERERRAPMGRARERVKVSAPSFHETVEIDLCLTFHISTGVPDLGNRTPRKERRDAFSSSFFFFYVVHEWCPSVTKFRAKIKTRFMIFLSFG